MKKHLGQHFLINKPAIGKIISALDLKPDDTIIEIGPGEGALTFPILEQCQKLNCKVIVIEKDFQLAKKLGENFQVLTGDALKILPDLISNTPSQYKVVGNIPYYITGKLLRILSESEKKPQITVLMIQKEVAKRLSVGEGKMNLLAAAVQFWAEPEILFTLKPDDFNPPPKVESAVVRLTPKATIENQDGAAEYYRLIKAIFKQPRKTLINNLKEGTDLSREEIESALLELKMDQKSRPQDLSVEKIKKLARIINK